RVGQGHDAHFHLSFLDFLQNLVAEISIDADLDQRIQLLEPGEGLGQDIKTRRLIGPDRKLAARSLVELRDGLQRFFLKSQQSFSVTLQDFSGGSQPHLFPAAVKQLLPTLLLEQSHLSADRRLGTEEFFRRPRKTSQPRNLE